MNQSVSYKTPKGATVSITLVTERSMVADHTLTESCWTIEYTINGKQTFGKRVNHPQVGAAIELDMGVRYEGKRAISMTATAPIPADKLAEVDALLAVYMAGIKERSDRRDAADAADAQNAAWNRFIASDGGKA